MEKRQLLRRKLKKEKKKGPISAAFIKVKSEIEKEVKWS